MTAPTGRTTRSAAATSAVNPTCSTDERLAAARAPTAPSSARTSRAPSPTTPPALLVRRLLSLPPDSLALALDLKTDLLNLAHRPLQPNEPHLRERPPTPPATSRRTLHRLGQRPSAAVPPVGSVSARAPVDPTRRVVPRGLDRVPGRTPRTAGRLPLCVLRHQVERDALRRVPECRAGRLLGLARPARRRLHDHPGRVERDVRQVQVPDPCV